MLSDAHTSAAGANIHENHLCDHEDSAGIRCTEWGCYGFEESKAITLWYCRKHQPLNYRGLPPHRSNR
ncbi:hypothetical protein HGP14_26405 [Rhizobium sp. P32RR-XVIII]|uniref:hypothetical protein n=1 Tax=Rhizobium sp. P32RR-XVIII TaxID=2726738 RepID=UPI00145745FC|nr:hypothetical protein [Rhizobium sp. P32RR-XVIII]NLS06847.1 hypothetical protein [Rhizobium sp. P32RR-XVIII]